QHRNYSKITPTGSRVLIHPNWPQPVPVITQPATPVRQVLVTLALQGRSPGWILKPDSFISSCRTVSTLRATTRVYTVSTQEQKYSRCCTMQLRSEEHTSELQSRENIV